MKKVRFESPVKVFAMDESECQSPRPFINMQHFQSETCYNYPTLLTFNPDPVQRFECSNSSPYPLANKTNIGINNEVGTKWLPSNDLELSMLDCTSHEPRKPVFNSKQLFLTPRKESDTTDIRLNSNTQSQHTTGVLTSIENIGVVKQPNNVSDNNFFIQRNNLINFNENGTLNNLPNQLHRLSLGKENDPLGKKAQLIKLASENLPREDNCGNVAAKLPQVSGNCQCHNCIKLIQNMSEDCGITRPLVNARIEPPIQSAQTVSKLSHHSVGRNTVCSSCQCHHCAPIDYTRKLCGCNKKDNNSPEPQTVVDKKAWILQKYASSEAHDCMEVEKQQNISKEKREPTVADLFKIIKLQNEQLQLLQEKVDKFISASSSKSIDAPQQNYTTEQITLETVNNGQQKISIGVMTSFEMVRTSTVINKEILTQTNESSQIQCNRSQISIKEVVSKSQPVNLNFLEGIFPAGKNTVQTQSDANKGDVSKNNASQVNSPQEIVNDDKTVNELSLFNVQVDNAITPLMSPEQSLYLDIRDYSGSESGSDDQSNVGWTYYNKVMTHVNGMLQDSEMPSSASAMYRATRQQCVQMQIDKTNVSVTKRVKFGDDPMGIQQPHIYAAPTDTSLKMNQLAAKYLKGGISSPQLQQQVLVSKPVLPVDMSFATRNYMERHRLLQGNPVRSPPPGEIPKFLDITALKQQPKFL